MNAKALKSIFGQPKLWQNLDELGKVLEKVKSWSFFGREYTFSGFIWDKDEVHFCHIASGGEPGVAMMHRWKVSFDEVIDQLRQKGVIA